MSFWKRLSNTWWGIPDKPAEWTDPGTFVVYPVGRSVPDRLGAVVKFLFRWLIAKPLRLLAVVISFVIAGLVGWAVFVVMNQLTGLG